MDNFYSLNEIFGISCHNNRTFYFSKPHVKYLECLVIITGHILTILVMYYDLVIFTVYFITYSEGNESPLGRMEPVTPEVRDQQPRHHCTSYLCLLFLTCHHITNICPECNLWYLCIIFIQRDILKYSKYIMMPY